MGLNPTQKAVLKWEGLASSDFLQVLDRNNNALGWIDSNGVPRGTLSGTIPFPGAPTGPCLPNQTAVNSVTGEFYSCKGGVWVLVASTSGSLVSPVSSPNPLAFDVNIAFKGPNPYVDVTRFGVRAIPASGAPATPGLTANCVSGSPNVTISAASIFQNGDGVVLYGCGPGTIGVPAAPTVTPSVLAGQTGLLLDVNGPVGSTTYCYQLVARTFMGATNVSPETCTTTGPASLGLQTNTITTISLVNNVATYTTSAAHGLVVGSQIVVKGSAVNTIDGQANGTSAFNPFDGWFKVAAAPDNTHFTVNLYSDTRNGAVASGTGGTLNYWNSIHITATETTGNYQYYVYGRVSGGTKTLIGVMWPQDVNLVVANLPSRFSDVTYLAFDDLGPTVTTFPNKPFFLPTTVPTTSTNDMLSTTIVSGAGTTSLVLANNAGNTINAQTILFDDAVTFLAAANNVAPNLGPLMLPEIGATANSIAYVFNSPITLPSGTVIYQKGKVRLNEPISMSNVSWYGETSATSSLTAFSNLVAPLIQFNTCSPCFFITSSSFFYNLTWSMLSGNGALGVIQEHGGIPASGAFREILMSTGSGANTYSNMMMAFRGDGNGYDFSNNSLVGTENGNLTATTPGIYFDLAANAAFTNLNMTGIGIAVRPQAAGAWLLMENVYSQGNYIPFVGIAAAASDPATSVEVEATNILFDTTQLPFIANYGGHPLAADIINPNTSTNDPVVTGSATPSSTFPQMALRISGATGGTKSPVNIGSSFVNTGSNAFDGIFGRVSMPIDVDNRSRAIGSGFSLFSTTGPLAAMTGCAVSAGGSVPVGSIFYYYAPIYPNGSEGTPSLYCLAPTTGGNQTVTLNWTAIPGVTKYNIYRGTNQTSATTNLLNCSPIIGTTLVDTLASTCGGTMALVAAGGPAGMQADLIWSQRFQTGDRAITQSGAGAPSAGLCTTSKGGSMYLRTDGTTTTTLYVCDGSSGTWTAK